MRLIRARFELEGNGMSKGHRYRVGVGDGSHSEVYTLAYAKDKYSTDMRWETLLGEPRQSFTWSSQSSEGMYVHIDRQYPDDDFDFSPDSYVRGKWLKAEVEFTHFRLYNPFLARPFLQWSTNSSRWDGPEVPFSEGDQKEFTYNIENQWSIDDNGNPYQIKIEEHGIKWTVRRNDDSDDYKEFVIRLSV